MSIDIKYKINEPLTTEEIIEVFKSSGISRPIADKSRIEMMFQNSNLVVSAWIEHELVGVSRSLTDFSYCCYLSDLAVKKEYQNTGVGKQMIELQLPASKVEALKPIMKDGKIKIVIGKNSFVACNAAFVACNAAFTEHKAAFVACNAAFTK